MRKIELLHLRKYLQKISVIGWAFIAILLFYAVTYAENGDNNPFDLGTGITDEIKSNIPVQDIQPKEIQANLFKIETNISPNQIRPGESALITIKFSIASEHYIYADRTQIIPDHVPGLTFGEIQKPAGIRKEDPYVGTIFMYKDDAEIQVPVLADKTVEMGKKKILLTVTYQGCSQAVCFVPEKKELFVELLISESAAPAKNNFRTPPDSVSSYQNKPDAVSPTQPKKEENSFQKTADKFGFMGVLVAAFLWGILASLTPCVYPMIPVTVSVIGTKSSGSTLSGFVLSLFYVLGLSLTYAIFGVIAAWSGGLFGEYTNHPAVRVIVAGIFVLLALSMFDMLYIQMPSVISSKLGNYTGSGNIGVFLTGAAAGAVVGPCVGPMLVGLLVYIAALGNKVQGFFIMWSFALGMGMLFLVIGTFSGAATALPRAGAWMEKIKNFFGLLMLAVALYYIKPLMPEKVFFLIIGTFFVGIAVFAGVLNTLNPEASHMDRLWKTAGIVFLALGIGYIVGFTWSEQRTVSEGNTAPQKTGIFWITDEALSLAQAKQQNRPLMIDFTAAWCTVCKRLERETFADPLVIEASKGFVCVRIDCTNTEDPEVRKLWSKYNVVGLPTITFIDSQGKILQDMAFTEFVNSDTLLKRMAQIR